MAWPMVRLLDICDVYQAETLSRKDMTDGGEFPVYGANGVIGRYHSFNHEDSEVLLGCRGSCGAVNVSDPKSWITSNAMVVKPKDGRLIKEFLRYFLDGGVDLTSTITGVAQPQITRTSLQPVFIPVPSLSEQKRIVAILDEAFEGIRIATAKTRKKPRQRPRAVCRRAESRNPCGHAAGDD